MSIPDAQSLLVAAAAGVVAVSTLGAAFLWLVKPRIQGWVLSVVEPIGRKVDETHQMTTVNAHKSQTPTVLDRLDTLRTSQLQYVEELAEVRVALEDHLMTAARDSTTLQRHTAELSRIRRAIATQAEAEKAIWPAIEAVARAQPADFMGIDRADNTEYDAHESEEQP